MRRITKALNYRSIVFIYTIVFSVKWRIVKNYVENDQIKLGSKVPVKTRLSGARKVPKLMQIEQPTVKLRKCVQNWVPAKDVKNPYIKISDGRWLLGVALCQLFTTADILLCTSSILNLCAIALDR